jgi:hypothetical protein
LAERDSQRVIGDGASFGDQGMLDFTHDKHLLQA